MRRLRDLARLGQQLLIEHALRQDGRAPLLPVGLDALGRDRDAPEHVSARQHQHLAPPVVDAPRRRDPLGLFAHESLQRS